MNSSDSAIPRLSLEKALRHIGDTYRRQLAQGSEAFLLTIGGCSQSGKTLAAQSFSSELLKSGVPSRVLSIDDFYFPTTVADPIERARSFDLPTSVDFDLLAQIILLWREGQECELPYLEYVPTVEGIPWTRRCLREGVVLPNVVVVEGIFAHYRDVADFADMSVFVDGPTETVRLQRRIVRDVSVRGFSEEMVRQSWESFVEPGCRRYVQPESLGSRARIDLFVKAGNASLEGASVDQV